MAYDKRALKILFKTYWGANGWKSSGELNWSPTTPQSDLEYAMRAGIMFAPVYGEHDETIAALKSLAASANPNDAGAAFLFGLGRQIPAKRSALGSLATAIGMPRHKFSPDRTGISCSVCGGLKRHASMDLNVLNFERHKWGGGRHTDPFYVAFDLERFTAEGFDPPSIADGRILASLLRAISDMPVGSKRVELLQAIRPLIPGNDYQRIALLEGLALAGIFRIPGHSGFFREFTQATFRADTPWTKDDWPYPLGWWEAGHGIDIEALEFWFGKCSSTVGAMEPSSDSASR